MISKPTALLLVFDVSFSVSVKPLLLSPSCFCLITITPLSLPQRPSSPPTCQLKFPMTSPLQLTNCRRHTSAFSLSSSLSSSHCMFSITRERGPSPCSRTTNLRLTCLVTRLGSSQRCVVPRNTFFRSIIEQFPMGTGLLRCDCRSSCGPRPRITIAG